MVRGFPIVRILAFSLALILALAAAGSTWAAIQWSPWSPNGEVKLSQNGEVKHLALAVGESRKAAAWWADLESDDRKDDLILAQDTGNGWAITTVTSTLQSRGPSLAYSGTALFIVWVQGQKYEQPASAFGGRLWEQDPQERVRLVTDTIFYGDENWLRPRLRVGQDDLHLVFAAAVTSTQDAPRHLYYAYRPFSSDQWSVTRVVTSSRAGPGKVYFPDMALGDGHIHIVWEQGAHVTQAKIYYISGTLESTGPLWDQPVPLSSDENGQQPAVAVDGSGRVHVVWTRYDDQKIQYILYRRLEGGEWTQVQYLSGEDNLKVNQNNPTVVWPAIAAWGNQVCVAWHGFYPDAVLPYEEIFLRCSKDSGRTWGPILNASRSPNHLSLYPALAISAGGIVHLAWEEFQGGDDPTINYDAMYAYGLPNVKVFLPLVLRNYR